MFTKFEGDEVIEKQFNACEIQYVDGIHLQPLISNPLKNWQSTSERHVKSFTNRV